MNSVSEITADDAKNVPTAERILSVATACFARKGYHGASMRDIASQTGISIATLYYYARNKDDLYWQVFERQYLEENELIENILHDADENTVQNTGSLAALLFRLVDALIDRSIANPDIVRLWTWRWLEQPEKSEDIEARYSIPLYQMVESLLERAQKTGVIRPGVPDLSILSHSFTWLHYGYFGLGQLTFGERLPPTMRQHSEEEFRAFAHQYICRMLNFSD
jgi:TetR/AcrR family transcriptional regulator, regulator of cefoperazone and chloramphenicol sensitivity